MAAVAEALRLSPSAISQQLTLLEAEAGVQLIDRRGRGVTLTPAGERLVLHAERIVSVLEEAKTDLAELRRVVVGDLRVAAFPSIASVLIPETMRDMQKSYPRLAVILEEMEPANGLAALRAWQADVALVDDLTIPAELAESTTETLYLTTDLLYAILPLSHPLSEREDISLMDLSGEQWAFDTASSTYAEVIIKSCRMAGFEPSVNAKCNSFGLVLSLVQNGCSVSILPGFRIREHSDICIRKVVPEVRRRIFVAYRRGERRNPAIAAFIAQLQANAGKLASFNFLG